MLRLYMKMHAYDNVTNMILRQLCLNYNIILIYRIAGNFARRKISPFSPRRTVGEIFFGELFFQVNFLSR